MPKRIAIDIDSTLHHYWDVLSAAARRRFGIDLPYEEQRTWGVTRLRDEQLRVCVAETHCEKAILAGRPYPGAVETINAWHDAGHFIQIASHRTADAYDATERWLRSIGLAFDELHCCTDKVAGCREGAIDLLIDDSPVTIEAALEQGLRVATILHPWNEDVCETEDVVCARDWPGLRDALAPLLADDASRVA